MLAMLVHRIVLAQFFISMCKPTACEALLKCKQPERSASSKKKPISLTKVKAYLVYTSIDNETCKNFDKSAACNSMSSKDVFSEYKSKGISRARLPSDDFNRI